MQAQLHSVSHPLQPSKNDSKNGSKRSRPTEDVVYQAVTVAAILLVLGTLWVF